MIIETTCVSALNKLKRKTPYGWDLNIYQCCGHGCKYCYARDTHNDSGEDDCIKIIAKTNIAEQLDRELSESTWNREVVNIGGLTDSYQPVEKDIKIMPDVLSVLIKHKTPAIISTKSDLILRDYDLIAELSEITYVNIASTITIMDEDVRKQIEPGCSDSQSRFNMLKEFRKTNASIGLHTMPIIPYLTDSLSNIESLCLEADKARVHYMLPGVLYLRGLTRNVFFDFITRTYPDKYEKLKRLYKTGGADKTYKDNLYTNIVNTMRTKYGISSSYIKPMKEKMHR